MYIISETTRRARRLLMFNYNADRVVEPLFTSDGLVDHFRGGIIDYTGNLSINDYLDMTDTYRVLVMDMDEYKPYYQMNNVVLTSCTKGGFFAIGNQWEYSWVAANMTPFPEMNLGWDDYYFGEEKINFEF